MVYHSNTLNVHGIFDDVPVAGDSVSTICNYQEIQIMCFVDVCKSMGWVCILAEASSVPKLIRNLKPYSCTCAKFS